MQQDAEFALRGVYRTSRPTKKRSCPLLFTSICSLHGMVQPFSISGHAFLQSTLPMVLLAEAGSTLSKPQQRKARSASNLVALSAFFQP